MLIRVEAPTTDHLRDYVPHLEKYKRCNLFPCRKIEIQYGGLQIFGYFIPQIETIVKQVVLNIAAMSRVYHNHSFLLTLALITTTCSHDTTPFMVFNVTHYLELRNARQ